LLSFRSSPPGIPLLFPSRILMISRALPTLGYPRSLHVSPPRLFQVRMASSSLGVCEVLSHDPFLKQRVSLNVWVARRLSCFFPFPNPSFEGNPVWLLLVQATGRFFFISFLSCFLTQARSPFLIILSFLLSWRGYPRLGFVASLRNPLPITLLFFSHHFGFPNSLSPGK